MNRSNKQLRFRVAHDMMTFISALRPDWDKKTSTQLRSLVRDVNVKNSSSSASRKDWYIVFKKLWWRGFSLLVVRPQHRNLKHHKNSVKDGANEKRSQGDGKIVYTTYFTWKGGYETKYLEWKGNKKKRGKKNTHAYVTMSTGIRQARPSWQKNQVTE